MNMCLMMNGCPDTAVGMSVTLLFVGADKGQSLQKKGGYTRRIARSHFGCCCPRKENVKINSDEQHVIFAHELESVLRLPLAFSNVRCELQQICHFCVAKLSF